MPFIISISVRVKETYNTIMFGQRLGPKYCVIDMDDMSSVWLLLLQIKLRFCVLKAVIKFQMWGTSLEGAGKHADDPASDITLP